MYGRAPVSAASSSSGSARRATATTSNPSFVSRRAVAAPIPLLAPVTTAMPATSATTFPLVQNSAQVDIFFLR
jgi:hypothetical protein